MQCENHLNLGHDLNLLCLEAQGEPELDLENNVILNEVVSYEEEEHGLQLSAEVA